MGYTCKTPEPPTQTEPVRSKDMTTPNIITRLKAHPGITDETTVGVVSSFGKGAEVDLKADTRDIVATLTTSDIDLEDEVLIPGGADMTYFKANKMIFADHRYDMENYVGVLRGLSLIGDPENPKGWKMRFTVSDSPLGNTAMKIVEHAGQIGISVGFKVMDHGPPTDEESKAYGVSGKKPRSIVRAFDVFEGSTTCLPCNVACQAVIAGGSKSARVVEGRSVDMYNAVDSLLRRGLIEREYVSLLGMPITPDRKVFAVSVPRRRFEVVGA